MYEREVTHLGPHLVKRGPGGTNYMRLPDRDGITISCWVKPTEFHGTLPWEWVITNMPVTVVTGMSSGYCRTRWGARRAAKRALRFWSDLGYTVTYKGAQ
jgi:hypothetical protein